VGSGVTVGEAIGVAVGSEGMEVAAGWALAMTSKSVSSRCPMTSMVPARVPKASPPKTGIAQANCRLSREDTELSPKGRSW
jgi:hypothetical protein